MSILQESDEVAICKRALAWAEQDANFDSLEDDTSQAREARLRYDARRRTVLEALDWNFARSRSLAVLRTNVVTPYDLTYAINRPNFCLRVRAVETDGRKQRFSVEEHVFTDHHAPNTQIIFTLDQDRWGLFPPSFVQALEFLLAAEFTMLYARSLNRANEYLANYRRVLQEADVYEGFERSDDDAYAASPLDLELSAGAFRDPI